MNNEYFSAIRLKEQKAAYLAHYGVPNMRWGHRKDLEQEHVNDAVSEAFDRTKKKLERKLRQHQESSNTAISIKSGSADRGTYNGIQTGSKVRTKQSTTANGPGYKVDTSTGRMVQTGSIADSAGGALTAKYKNLNTRLNSMPSVKKKKLKKIGPKAPSRLTRFR